MPTGMLAENDLRALEAHVDRIHDLVGRSLDHDTVLMDAGLVREGVGSHDRLVGRHLITREPRHKSRRPRYLARSYSRAEIEFGSSGSDGHHDLLERAIPGALPYAVDGHFDLPGSRLNAGKGI